MKQKWVNKMAGVPRMIFFNIGWMERYEGPDGEVGTLGGHQHLRENRFGYECFNFRPIAENCYGYRPASSDIRIERLGAPKGAEFVDDVIVIWIARDPIVSKTVVVGWYSSARVLRAEQFLPKGKGHRLEGNEVGYFAVAPRDSCVLVPAIARTFQIPTKADMDGGLGQSTIWYGANDDFRKRIWRYIQRFEARATPAKIATKNSAKVLGRHNQDPEQRSKIESTAIRIATDHFGSREGGSYHVTSKEKDNLGWDLEASLPSAETLLIEVKGLCGTTVNVQLTPNEFEKMSSREFRNHYVLFVVTDCLGSRPQTHEFRYEGNVWVCTDGTLLKVLKRTGAICQAQR